MATPTVECRECCGEGYDLDTLYWGDEYCEAGTEVDCSVCGGDGTVPDIGEKEVDSCTV